jgi:hypothetical protein
MISALVIGWSAIPVPAQQSVRTTEGLSTALAEAAHIDSVGVMRGLKPPPPSGLSFSADCDVVP